MPCWQAETSCLGVGGVPAPEFACKSGLVQVRTPRLDKPGYPLILSLGQSISRGSAHVLCGPDLITRFGRAEALGSRACPHWMLLAEVSAVRSLALIHIPTMKFG